MVAKYRNLPQVDFVDLIFVENFLCKRMDLEESRCFKIVFRVLRCVMRTTVTLDDDLRGILQRQAREQGVSFREVVNRTLRLGLAREISEKSSPTKVRTRSHKFGFKAGVDLDRLDQIDDELEAVAVRDRQISGQA